MYFVSIDIETTGLDQKVHGITEIGAVLSDRFTTIDKFYRWCNPEGFVWSNYCSRLHKDWLIKCLHRIEMGDTDTYPVIETNERNMLNAFLDWYRGACQKMGIRKLPIVGKNFGRFDSRFLHEKGIPDDAFPIRSGDPGLALWQEGDTGFPDLKGCLLRSGIEKSVAHNALEDAEDVAEIVRRYMNRVAKPSVYTEDEFAKMKSMLDMLRRASSEQSIALSEASASINAANATIDLMRKQLETTSEQRDNYRHSWLDITGKYHALLNDLERLKQMGKKPA